MRAFTMLRVAGDVRSIRFAPGPRTGAAFHIGNAMPNGKGKRTAKGLQADGQVEGMDATADAGERFVAWLKQCIENKSIPINEPQARIHVLPEGLALVSPRIFRDFDSANWSHVQKRFQKLKLHRKTAKDENIWSCQVEGSRKQAILKIILIPNAATTLGINLPHPNPAVKLLDTQQSSNDSEVESLCSRSTNT